MQRRDFLKRLSVGVAGLALDPERLLWTPGQRSYIFLAAPRPHLSIAQIVAATYEQVLAERRVWDHQWMESAFLREMERTGKIARVTVAQVEDTWGFYEVNSYEAPRVLADLRRRRRRARG